MSDDITLCFTPKQTEALDIIDQPQVREVMYGGAKGGGKSVFFCMWAFLQCQKLIQLWNIPQNPDTILPVGFLGRKRGVDFVKTTLETWKKMIPSKLYKIRPLDKEIIIDGRVKMFYGGMDDEHNVNKMNSAEFAFIGIDQAEEMHRDDLGLLKGTLRLRRDGIVPDYKVLLTANPAPCFLKYDYIDNPPEDGSKVFIQALPTDNPFLDDQYVQTLYDAFKHRPELIRAYIHGSWDDIESLDILIKGVWVNNCIGMDVRNKEGKRITSADVARYGHDETVIYNLLDNKIEASKIYGMKDTNYTAAEIIKMAHKNNSELIVIDGDGFGGGVVDLVKKILKGNQSRIRVMEINSGKKAITEDKYVNLKTEMWFYASEQFAEENVSIPQDDILVNDLTNVKYNTSNNGRFMVEPKKEVRKRISRSPDRADALVYGIWGSKFVKKRKRDFSRIQQPAKKDSYGWQNLQTSKRGYGLA